MFLVIGYRLFVIVKFVVRGYRHPVRLLSGSRTGRLIERDRFTWKCFLNNNFVGDVTRAVQAASGGGRTLQSHVHLSFCVNKGLRQYGFFSFFVRRGRVIAQLWYFRGRVSFPLFLLKFKGVFSILGVESRFRFGESVVSRTILVLVSHFRGVTNVHLTSRGRHGFRSFAF